MEDFVRSYGSPFSREDAALLVKEFKALNETRSEINLALDGSTVGYTSYIETATQAELILIAAISTLLGEYITDLGIPFLYQSLVDEGYQIQEWTKKPAHWISNNEGFDTLERVLKVIFVLDCAKDAKLEFRHHKAISLKKGKVYAFPALNTHTYMLEPGSKSLFIASTFVRALGPDSPSLPKEGDQ
jgi:hypothetical protein